VTYDAGSYEMTHWHEMTINERLSVLHSDIASLKAAMQEIIQLLNQELVLKVEKLPNQVDGLSGQQSLKQINGSAL
jgi:hypothetical protein